MDGLVGPDAGTPLGRQLCSLLLAGLLQLQRASCLALGHLLSGQGSSRDLLMGRNTVPNRAALLGGSFPRLSLGLAEAILGIALQLDVSICQPCFLSVLHGHGLQEPWTS